jgi:hypothetical protein
VRAGDWNENCGSDAVEPRCRSATIVCSSDENCGLPTVNFDGGGGTGRLIGSIGMLGGSDDTSGPVHATATQ